MRNPTLSTLALLMVSWFADPRPPISPAQKATPQILSVAAASDLKFALDEIVLAFQREHSDIRVRVSYGSSGNFYAQLAQRAPFDLFFSADVSYPTKLVDAGLAVANSKFSYAMGRIVVWAPTNSPIDPTKLGAAALQHPALHRIAIANPDHAPYGKAAVAALVKLGIYDAVKSKLVFGENIAQTAQFVDTGADSGQDGQRWSCRSSLL